MTTIEKIRTEIDCYLKNNEFGTEYRNDIKSIIDKYAEQELCEDCDYSEIVDWEQDAKTGKAKPIYWCEKHKEPCTDSVSRQAVLDLIEHYNSDGLGSVFYGYEEGVKFADAVNKLPSVRPQPCDDAISREELLKAIDTWDKFGCNADTKLVPYQDHYIPYIHYDDVVKCIKGMPSVRPQEPKWIPVSEPPKELGTYWVQTDGEPYMCQCRWTDVNPFWTDLKTKPHWSIFDLPQYSKVVAWQPLPKPYEPQESEDK